MALWVIRGGRHGEYEQHFLTTNRVYLTWEQLNYDLSQISKMAELRELLQKTYHYSVGALSNYSGQVWAFYRKMKQGDWVVMPSKLKPAICVAEIKGDYTFDGNAEDPYCHYRDVKWIASDIPRSNFDQDLLYSFGAFRTVCQVQRNDAEKRVRAMGKSGWKSTTGPKLTMPPIKDDDGIEIEPEVADLEELARDQIGKLIVTKFKGHSLALLVDGILRAQGYTTYVSSEGPDKGIDILAAPGALGFGEPRICVQVKSGDSPIDRPTLDQLIGVMQNVQAQQGLLVSLGGFKASVDREKANQFFKVRLWDQKDLIEKLLANYDKLDDDIRADLPLKRIWTVANPEGKND